MNTRSYFLGTVFSIGVAFRITAAESDNLIVGNWSSGSQSNWSVPLKIGASEITFGTCERIQYKIIRDEYGAPRSGIDAPKAGRWRNVAVEFLLNREDPECRYLGQVIELSIPDVQICHADLATFETRSDFDKGKPSGWSVWANSDCISPNPALKADVPNSTRP